MTASSLNSIFNTIEFAQRFKNDIGESAREISKKKYSALRIARKNYIKAWVKLNLGAEIAKEITSETKLAHVKYESSKRDYYTMAIKTLNGKQMIISVYYDKPKIHIIPREIIVHCKESILSRNVCESVAKERISDALNDDELILS